MFAEVKCCAHGGLFAALLLSIEQDLGLVGDVAPLFASRAELRHDRAHRLDALGARGPITVEGAFTANPWFGPLLASLGDLPVVICASRGRGTPAPTIEYARSIAAPGNDKLVASKTA